MALRKASTEAPSIAVRIHSRRKRTLIEGGRQGRTQDIVRYEIQPLLGVYVKRVFLRRRSRCGFPAALITGFTKMQYNNPIVRKKKLCDCSFRMLVPPSRSIFTSATGCNTPTGPDCNSSATPTCCSIQVSASLSRQLHFRNFEDTHCRVRSDICHRRPARARDY